MRAHPLVLLDSSSSLAQTLSNIANALFQIPVIIAALVLTFVCAAVAWMIARYILKDKTTCSMVCVIHFLLTIATIVLGLLSAIGLIDHYFPGSLITGSGVALLILTLPLFILVMSFEHVVLGNDHARMHRALRTPQDKAAHRWTVFLTPLVIGAVLLVVGLIVAAAAVSVLAQAIILLLVLWILAIGAELIILALANRRKQKMAALGTTTVQEREEVAALWVSGYSSYRTGRGETVFSEKATVIEQETAWGEFTKRVFVTEDLLVEEEGRLDLLQVEEEETVTYTDASGAGIVALHNGHRGKQQNAQNHFFRRYGGALLLLLVALVVVAVAVVAGSLALITTAGIALAFLAPVIFLVVHRFRRDSDLAFATATADKVSTVRYSSVVAEKETVITETPTLTAPPSTRRTTGSQTAVPLHPARPVPVTPPIAEPEIERETVVEETTLTAIETTEGAGAAHENPDIAEDTVVIAGAAAAGAMLAGGPGAAHENANVAEETLLIEHTPVSEVSDRISIIEFQQYLRGIRYPATRAQLIAQARQNEAPPAMFARLELLEETYTFISVSDVMRGYAYHRYLYDAHYPASRDQLLIHARARKAPKKLIDWLEGLEATVVFANLGEVLHSYTTHLQAKGEESSVEAELIEAAPTATEEAAVTEVVAEQPRVSRSIGIIAFQHYLHGVDYPATRAQLIAKAQENGAPPNMIARLEELEETHSFVNVRDVMIGYAYHRYLRGVTYPASRGQLLAHARANNAPGKLVGWLEGLNETVTFASLTEVVRSYSTHHEEEVEVEDEDEDKTITLVPTEAADEGLKGIGSREFVHHLRGIHFPATRDQLLAQARQNEAPASMIARLEELPEHHSYTGMADVMRGYGHHISEEEGK